ncbi:MAG: hypothetical protein ACNA7G_15270 [Methylobacter sp.]
MNEHKEQPLCEPKVVETRLIASLLDRPNKDDNNPGSFFRIPAPPMLGKTGWRLN